MMPLINRRKLLLASASVLILSKKAKAAFALFQLNGVVIGWSQLKIGGGGYMTGLAIHLDGSMASRVDVMGGYVGSTTLGTTWRQLVTSTSMPSIYSSNHPYAAGGLVELVFDPSNSSNMWMFWSIPGHSLSTILKSTDKGLTWQSTTFTDTADNSNDQSGGGRYARGQCIAVDPNNSNVVYVGTKANGLFVTADGGATWNAVTAVPTSSTNGVCAIVFDSTSGTNGGTPPKTNRLLVGSNGNGIYESHDAGSTWAVINSGSPNSIGHGKLGIDGTAYFSDFAQTHIYRVTTANVVTDITPSGSSNGTATIAPDPFNADKLVCTDTGGSLTVSVNCRVATPAWTAFNPSSAHATITSPDVLWLQNSADRFLSMGEIWLDPVVPNRLWMAMGTGVLYTDNVYALSGPSNVQNFISQVLGIENLVANQISVPPGGSPLLACWDRPLWKIDNPDVYQANYKPGYTTGLTNPVMFGASINFAVAAPSFVVGLISLGTFSQWGYSTDGGSTWSAWPTAPGFNGVGGCIAAFDANTIVIAESNNGEVHQMTNGGLGWTVPPTLPTSGYGNFYANNGRPLCVDRADPSPGTFYLYNYVTPGLYISTDGGVTWSLQYSGHISTNDAFAVRIDAVPLNSGHLFFTAGLTSDLANYSSLTTLAASFPTGQPLYRSTNRGAAWSAVPNVSDIIDFGFGAPKPGGGGYPTVWIIGWVSGVYGIWRSDDAQNATPTWTNVGTFPRNWLDQPTCLAGDPNTYNRCYIGFQGSGFDYYKGS